MFRYIVFPICLLLVGIMTTSAYAKEGGSHAPGVGKIGGDHWADRITVSGLLEAEYGQTSVDGGASESDIVLATVELAFEAKLNDKVSTHLSFLYEEGDTTYEVDEGYIAYNMGGFTIKMGQMYVPFGSYETNVISDPLTLEIGETRDSALMLEGEAGSLQYAAYLFNGVTLKTGSEEAVDKMGLRLAFVKEGMDIGVDYISNIADTATVSSNVTSTPAIQTEVSGMVLHANLTFGSLHVIFENLTSDKFDAADLSFKGNGAELSATNMEVGYDFNMGGMESTFAVAMQTTEEASGLGLPESRMLIALSMKLQKDTALSFEYATSSDYSIADGGTGADSTSITAQLAVGF
ncbi:MAG: LbtU family siderophore porin [Gammaproteobacteria bacterium]|nr:LbtU family siderophore porin [Gammaproteobacteria bacterium]MDH5650310.1 LbtU family siderophore porin [Gammaproteobacteria bacterium]